jgi:hypothetical protein
MEAIFLNGLIDAPSLVCCGDNPQGCRDIRRRSDVDDGAEIADQIL